jgi:uncharacterized protein (TIGR02452 family)
MNDKETVRASKFLSLILRHEPSRVGLQLDGAGWVDVDLLLEAVNRNGVPLTLDQLIHVVETNPKKRFALSEDGMRIRASQGHSLEVNLQYEPEAPPELLYHGTAERFVDAIRRDGLQRMQRHDVHLSAETAVTVQVGARHGKPVLLTIRAGEMHKAGHLFRRSANGVWLVPHVPAQFIDLSNSITVSRGQSTSNSMTRKAQASETVAICEKGFYVAPSGKRVEIEADVSRAKTRTLLYSPENVPAGSEAMMNVKTTFSVLNETTFSAIKRVTNSGMHIGCLNFASAKNPGGGFLGGAEAQEEALARSSALYPCLLKAPDYYARNRANRSTIYLDLAIYSPLVPFFRDDSGTLLEDPLLASVITAPAPNAGAILQNEPQNLAEVAPALARRANLVLSIARVHNVEKLILGAWGCGVFRNDPKTVASAFAALLQTPGRFADIFDEVIFAVFDRTEGHATHRAFGGVFGENKLIL